MTIFAVTLRLRVKGPMRREHFEHVTDCYAALEEKCADLLDCSWEYREAKQGHGRVIVDVTVDAADEHTAFERASASVRSAIHEAGGATPTWDEVPDGSTVVYRLTDENVELVPA